MKCTYAKVVGLSSVFFAGIAFGETLDTLECEAERLEAEHARLEAQLDCIKNDKHQCYIVSPDVNYTEETLEAERQRRREAKFKIPSFAGYKFGSYAFHDRLDADNSREEDLMIPIRIFKRARLFYTPSKKELWRVKLIGYVDGTTSRDDCYVELAKVMEIVKDRYDVDLKQCLKVREGHFDSWFHKEVGRMDFDGSVGPGGKDGNGRNRIAFTLAVSNYTAFDKEPVSELKIDKDEDAKRF